MECWDKYITGCMMLECVSRQIVGKNKEWPKVVVEEAVPEAARLGEMIEAIYPHEKEQEGEVAIAMEEIHSRYEPVKGEITYRC